MKTLLIFPPSSDPAHPPLGIAALAGFLGSANKEVSLLDLNVLSYYYLLSKENIGYCAEKMSGRLQELDSKRSLPVRDAEEYRLIAENIMSGKYLGSVIEKTLRSLKRQETYSSRSGYMRVSSIIRRAMEFVSAAHYPVRWYPRGFSMSYLPTRSADVMKAVSDSHENIFMPFYESILPEIARRKPDIIGISINYYCQLIPGIALASILKKNFADTFIVAGGGLICFFEGEWKALQPFSDVIDGFIPYEGELPLLALIDALEKKTSLSDVPGLLHFSGGLPRYNPPGNPPEIKNLPLPDFKDLPLDKYLSPELVLPNLTSRGCYWGRCAFCSHDHLYRGRFRKKTSAQVLKETAELSKRFHASHFYFTDESIPPATALEIAGRNKASRSRFNWFGECRFEKSLDSETLREMAEGGCRMLMFGLESGEKRVLDLMEKGTSPEHVSRVLRNCGTAGIRTFVMFFAGFPTETKEEAERTVGFIEAHRECITHTSFTNFILEKRSPVYAAPEKFGLSVEEPAPGDDLKIYAGYKVRQGLTDKEAVSFLDEIKTRPGIVSLIETYLISRTHLVFLPLEKTFVQETGISRSGFELSERAYPAIHDDVIALTLQFSLERIRSELESPPGNGRKGYIRKFPGNYLFKPDAEKLIEVGEDGHVLARASNGRHSLKDILAVLGRKNKDAAVSFYRQLHETGFLYLKRGI